MASEDEDKGVTHDFFFSKYAIRYSFAALFSISRLFSVFRGLYEWAWTILDLLEFLR